MNEDRVENSKLRTMNINKERKLNYLERMACNEQCQLLQLQDINTCNIGRRCINSINIVCNNCIVSIDEQNILQPGAGFSCTYFTETSRRANSSESAKKVCR